MLGRQYVVQCFRLVAEQTRRESITQHTGIALEEQAWQL